MRARFPAACLGLLMLAACTPALRPAGRPIQAPAALRDAFVMADGARLPYASWLPPGPPRAIILGVHGFGDYSFNSFDIPAPLFNAAGIGVFAYDQRGFGAGPHGGIWAGGETLAADATAVTRLLRARHPGVPIILMGESMGVAVLLAAATSADPPPADGYVLLAPGIRGRATMGGFARSSLEFAAHAIPAVGFNGGAPGFVPTDNPEAMRRWSADPLTLKTFRIDLLYGLVNLMDAALAAAPRFDRPVLVLYGGKDVIVPARPVRLLLRAMPDTPARRLAFYPDGYHLLLRDRERAAVARDIIAWLAAPEAPLPSGADTAATAWLAEPPP